jgi:glycosyltransferase involved in cell wall biosynthesis
VGSGWWEEDLRKYVAEVGAADVVVFEGQVSEERKHEVYAHSWLLALPSLKEGWGLVVGEAGTHGVPAVAYAAAGGTRESITHGQSGLLVDDPAQFTEAIRSLLRDSEQRHRLGEGARAKARTFGWEQSQEAFAQVLDAVLAGRRVGA